MAAGRKQVTVWTHGPGENEWAEEVYEDVGFGDLVRVYLGWAVGSGPGAGDMVFHNVVESRPDHDSKTVTDTQKFVGSGAPPEVDKAQDPIYLASALAAQAEADGVVYFDRRDRS